MYLQTGYPFRGVMLDRLKRFLRSCGLDYDENIGFTAAFMEDDEIIATGSLDGATLKCIAVSPLHQGEGLTAAIMTELHREAFARGLKHLMLFTKPGNRMMFYEFGFSPIVETQDVLLMENPRNSLGRFLDGLERPADGEGPVGAVVVNCNPFTLGHRYLIETASKQCRWLHVFVLSEDKSMFSAATRYELVQKGVADLKNVIVHPTGPYLISSATFPSYFIKDKTRLGDMFCELDLRIFGQKFAPALNITHRFVGTEPHSEVTNAYNSQLKAKLPAYGIEVHELTRIENGGAAISASRVRALFEQGRLEDIRPLVPDTTYEYLLGRYNAARSE